MLVDELFKKLGWLKPLFGKFVDKVKSSKEDKETKKEVKGSSKETIIEVEEPLPTAAVLPYSKDVSTTEPNIDSLPTAEVTPLIEDRYVEPLQLPPPEVLSLPPPKVNFPQAEPVIIPKNFNDSNVIDVSPEVIPESNILDTFLPVIEGKKVS